MWDSLFCEKSEYQMAKHKADLYSLRITLLYKECRVFILQYEILAVLY